MKKMYDTVVENTSARRLSRIPTHIQKITERKPMSFSLLNLLIQQLNSVHTQ